MASNTETEDITSYRRAVVDVFFSYYNRIRNVLKGNMEDFTSRAFSAHFISSQNMEFAIIFEQFKTGFESCRSISDIQQRYKCFIDILLDIGGPVKVVGNEIEEKLSNLTAAHKQQEQSSKLLQKYSARLSKLVLPMEVTQMLYTEGVISKETFDEIQSSGGWLTDNPLRALSDRVIVDPNMLRAFGTVLLQSKDTVHVGNDILREYEVHLQPTYQYSFDHIRAKFGVLILTITPLIESAVMPRLKEFKTFLQTCFPELKPQLSTAESFDDVMEIVREKCTITNVACLEVIVNHYKIEEATAHITTYKNEVKTFCEEVKLSVCIDENIVTNPSFILKCETIKFVLEWKGEEYSLNASEVLLKKAFKDMAKRVQVRYFGGEMIRREENVNKLIKGKEQEIETLKEGVSSLTIQLEEKEEIISQQNPVQVTSVTAVQTESTMESSVDKKDACIQFNYLVLSNDVLQGVCIADKKLFIIQGDSKDFLNWEEYGLRISVPSGTLSSKEICEISVTVLVGGKFQFPEGTELISAVYLISLSKSLLKPVKFEIQHCAHLVTEDHTRYLTFVSADVNQPVLPYQFQLQEGGEFHPGNQYGSIYLPHFCLKAIVKSRTDPIWAGNNALGPENLSFIQLNDATGGSMQTEVECDDKAFPIDIPKPTTETTNENSLIEDKMVVTQMLGNSTIVCPLQEVSSSNEVQISPFEGSLPVMHHKDKMSDDDKIVSFPLSSSPDHNATLVETLSNSELLKLTPSTTNSNQSAVTSQTVGSSSPDKKYVAQVVYEVKRHNRKWLMRLMAAKCLNALLKYIKNTLPSEYVEMDVELYFTFENDNGHIELAFGEDQKHPLNGWSICPHNHPTRIYQNDVDVFGSKDPPHFPSVLITVSVKGGPDTVSMLNYSVPLKGIKPENEIFIIRYYSTSNGDVLRRLLTNKEISETDIDHDVTTMKSYVKEVFTQNFERLQNTSRYSIKSLADKMFTNSLITDDVHRSPTFQNIFDEFIAGMEVTITINELKDHCVKFITACTNVGGPIAKTADILQKDLISRGMKL